MVDSDVVSLSITALSVTRVFCPIVSALRQMAAVLGEPCTSHSQAACLGIFLCPSGISLFFMGWGSVGVMSALTWDLDSSLHLPFSCSCESGFRNAVAKGSRASPGAMCWGSGDGPRKHRASSLLHSATYQVYFGLILVKSTSF